ncbi:hypothetical protein [Actomonas aquatica]|uniref:Uncharacterized protein n=1 Tax=Actomonas aquatica TaxID=2866162 RepID=A0ABZ1C9M0_9BACT|nr:hypothetical protein [Opitutus sp. WL0086]WRQ88294.1 hypothetical protein K1X11_002680 [Opitutus sp. WL0086]
MFPVIAAVATVSAFAQEPSYRREAAALFPRFDPHYSEAKTEATPPTPAPESAPEPSSTGGVKPAPRPRLERIPPLVLEVNQQYLARVAAGEEVEEPSADGDIVRMPEVTVESKRLPSWPLPRLQVEQPKGEGDKVVIEEFMTDAAKAEALIRKHLGPFDRLLFNRFDILGTKAKRAEDAEARAQFARAMNDLITAIEQSAIWGVTDEEREQLREEYYNLMVNRPQ